MIDMEDSDARTPLIEFGNLLREERVRRGYAVDEVAEQLKITSRMVRAIEDADLASMPHAVYARGFIRAYAKLLGIGDEEIRLACNVLKDCDEDNSSERTFVQPRTHGRGGGGIFGIVFVLLLIAGGAYWLYNSNIHLTLFGLVSDRATEKASPTLPATPPADAAQATPALSAPQNGSGAASGSNAESAGASTTPSVRDTGVLPQSSSFPVAPQAFAVPPTVNPGMTQAVQTAQLVAAAPVSSAQVQAERLTLQTGSGVGTPMSPNASGKRHQLILTALSECWVHSSADDTDTRQLSIQKGESFALSFDRKLVLKLGNAGGVRIKYDGKELPEPGTAGQVKTLVFPEAAIASSSAQD